MIMFLADLDLNILLQKIKKDLKILDPIRRQLIVI